MSVALFMAVLFGVPASMTKDAFNISYFGMEGKQFMGITNHPLISQRGRDLNQALNLNVNLRLFNSLYWINKIDALTDTGGNQAQFRTVAWENRFGLMLTDGFAIEIGHRSTHMLDDTFVYSGKDFYSEDWIGIKWTFHKGKQPKGAVK